MLEEMLNAYGSRLVIAVVGVGIAFVLLIVALRFMRGRNGPSPFIRGGKNRQPRLQVLDAAAVDTRRRLVLVRRDNVEHLIMIGGPTDIVVESGILTSPVGREAVQQVVAARAAAPELQPPAPSFDTERPQPVLEPRPVAPQRAAAVSLPAEPRVEPPREAAFAPEPVRAVRQAAAPAPAPTAAAVTPKPGPAPIVTPVAAAPLATPRVEPVVRQPAPEVRTEPLRPIAALAAANAAAQAPASIAVDALESARERVFQPAPTPSLTPALNPAPAPEPRILTPITSASMPPALQAAAEKPGQLGNDFERILEQEMASNLAAREAAAATEQNRQLPARDPAAPKVTGATPEPTLQAEVARIFGEMSVTRDK